MSEQSSLTKIVLALHVSAVDAMRIVNQMLIPMDTIPSREAAWSHVHRSDRDVTLVFGPAGLKRVRATHLIEQLAESGFRYDGCMLAVKSTDHVSRPKLCLEIAFLKAPSLSLAPQATHLKRVLAHLSWKRARVIILRGDDGNLGASVELVLPKAASTTRATELEFDPRHGFYCRRPYLP